jgi:DNA replication protein DnaD
MSGWIKIHRQFLDHWLCNENRPLTKREAWENMLLWANYAETDVLIRGQVIKCGRGQLVYSLDTLSKKFNWTKGATRHFLKILKNENMILIEGLKYTTRLTICNYERYQDEQHSDNILTTFSEHSDNILSAPRKEYKEEKEIKKNIYTQKNEKKFSDEVKELYKSTVILFDEKTRPKTKSQVEAWHDTLDKCIRIDGYSADQIKEIVKRTRMDDFWRPNFLSILKLRNVNKSGVKYIHVFASKLNSQPKKAFGIPEKQRNYTIPEKTF